MGDGFMYRKTIDDVLASGLRETQHVGSRYSLVQNEKRRFFT